MIFVLPKFRLVWVLLSIEGLRATQRRSALEGTTKVTLAGFFPTPFPPSSNLIPRQRNWSIQTFRGTLQSLGCSPVTPNHLGPRSPRVTNANHERDNIHKCSSGWIALFLKFIEPTIWFGKFDQSLTKRGLGELARLKNVYVSAESAASKGGGLEVFIAPFEKLAVL